MRARGNGSRLAQHRRARPPVRDAVALGMAVLILLSLGTLAALWLPQRPVRLALSVANVLLILVLLGYFIRRRR